jgi:hypothetical protein
MRETEHGVVILFLRCRENGHDERVVWLVGYLPLFRIQTKQFVRLFLIAHA